MPPSKTTALRATLKRIEGLNRTVKSYRLRWLNYLYALSPPSISTSAASHYAGPRHTLVLLCVAGEAGDGEDGAAAVLARGSRRTPRVPHRPIEAGEDGGVAGEATAVLGEVEGRSDEPAAEWARVEH
ncbi:hypothetical protein E2562_021902 [Oryza meyeriana var. granulata]|uniref:Uncharacterized protein n=1 Tax=Oryza meyeriana var. granulata TaxID=110450 RepID=A0A6G1C8L2_9ORYZ|nr:hypothetical protein E2562_021902 [Oryza meyeriana var. granulata]